MDRDDLERIARLALRELGTGDVSIVVTPESEPDRWRVEVGGSTPVTLSIRAGAGTRPQYVRDQIFEQFSRR